MANDNQHSRRPRNPLLTVDIIIEWHDRIVLVERQNPPLGWALPGGFVDYGESIEAAAIREAKEETSLAVSLIEQFHTYSDPSRDPRHHTVTTVFLASADGKPSAGDDAKSVDTFSCTQLPAELAFDHASIISDYCRYRAGIARRDIFRC
jgi:8-oxo-dGTP diphosphatase